MPKTFYDQEGAGILWVQNSENSVVPALSGIAETIYTARVRDGSVQETKTAFENVKYLKECAVGTDARAACLADEDGDLETVEDSVCYLSGMEEPLYRGDGLCGLYFENERFYFSEKGTLLSTDSSNPRVMNVTGKIFGTGAVRLVRDDSGIQAAIYEVSEGFSSELYASYSIYGEWTNPVPITSFGEKIRSWDIWTDRQGQIQAAALLAEVNVGEGENNLIDTARLAYFAPEPIEDLAADSFYTEESTVSRGDRTVFCVSVTNRSRQNLERAEVLIRGKESGILYQGTADARVPAGDTGTFRISAEIPKDFKMQEVEVEISSSELQEQNTENNKVSRKLGQANLSITLDGKSILTEGYVLAEIENNGCTDLEKAFLEISGEDGRKIFEKKLGQLKAGASQSIQAEVPEACRSFADAFDSYSITARVSSETQESTEEDNTAVYRIRPEILRRISVAEKEIRLAVGEAYLPDIRFYPANAADKFLYGVSDNTAVAAVNEEGRITAQGPGTANITYIPAGDARSVRLQVEVREEGESRCTLYLHPEGGSVEQSQITAEIGKTALLPTPVRKGYRFLGWFDQRQGGRQITGETTIYGDMQLYARWQKEDQIVPNPDSDSDPTPNPEPGDSQKPAPGGNQEGTATQKPEKIPQKKGKTFIAGKIKYKVTKAAKKASLGEVQAEGIAGKKKWKGVVIPGQVVYGGEKFQVTAIKAGAFKGNKKITSVILGEKIKKVGSKAFYGCSRLKNIRIKSKVLKNVGKNAVSKIHKKAVIKVPLRRQKDYRRMFGKKTGFKSSMKIRKL